MEFFKLINVTWKIFHNTTILMDSFNTGLKVTIKNGQKNVKQLYQHPSLLPYLLPSFFFRLINAFFQTYTSQGSKGERHMTQSYF